MSFNAQNSIEQHTYKSKAIKQLKCIIHRRDKHRKNSPLSSFSGNAATELTISEDNHSLNISNNSQLKRNNSSSGFELSAVFSTQSFYNKKQVANWTVSDSDRALNGRPEKVLKKQVEIYGQVFEDIIKQDEVYGGLLTTVKKYYDDYISELESDTRPKSTSDQIILEFEKLKNEIEKKDSLIASLQEQLQSERETSNEVGNKLSSELSTTRVREQKYAKLVSVLKEKGYPVEEIYTKYIKRRQRSMKNLALPVKAASPIQKLPRHLFQK